MIRYEKQKNYQYYHQRKLKKYEYLICWEILPFNQSRMIEQAKLTYSPLGKDSEKQTKMIKDQCKTQVEALTF